MDLTMMLIFVDVLFFGVILLGMSGCWGGSRGADGQLEGFGTWTRSNGDTATGEYRAGRQQHGPWVRVRSDGRVLDEVWNNNTSGQTAWRVS